MEQYLQYNLGLLLFIQHQLNSQMQFYSFLQDDIDLVKKGKKPVYSVEASDVSTLFFSKEMFGRKFRKHYKTNRANIETTIFNSLDKDFVNIVIDPLAVLDIIFYLRSVSYSNLEELHPEFKKINIVEVIKQVDKLTNLFQDPRNVPWNLMNDTILGIWDKMEQVLSLFMQLKISDNKSGLGGILNLISTGKVKYFQQYFKECEIHLPKNLFNCEPTNIYVEAGKKYLDDKRGTQKWKEVHSKLDMARLIGAGKISEILSNTDFLYYILSSGSITLNAWNYSYTGPINKKPFRPSTVSSYLVMAIKKYGDDYDLIIEIAKEAEYYLRGILRELDKIDELNDCKDVRKRISISKDKKIKINQNLIGRIINFYKTYYSEFCPEKLNYENFIIEPELKDSVNLIKLKKWLTNSSDLRKSLDEKAKDHITDFLNKQTSIDFNEFPLFNSISDAFLEIAEWIGIENGDFFS